MKRLNKSVFTFSILIGLGLAFTPQAKASFFRLKKYWEIKQGIESMTGVSFKRPEIMRYYISVMSTLPQNGEISEFSNKMVLAVGNLSALACDVRVNKDAAEAEPTKRVMNSFISFKDGPLKALSPVVLDRVLTEHAEFFYQRPLEQNERTELVALAEKLKLSFAGDPDGTVKTLKALCVTYLLTFETGVLQ